ncbi:hypothetical protein LSH36_311g03056 [Paralvinella palmiformis]|uniref:AB hydrolase-1 domain-containing protein n=1 Tax=Paralvinella palmiformis TaxID=53620 RepID=A0AAD9JHX8_9ANNE|nr:hypothetical protein LSH36_311g03056 [Paralvinella palmiformis]
MCFILDAPTGMMSDVWSLVQPELAKITKVCSYDRAGLGFSERAPVNYSADSNNELEMHFGNRWKTSTVERMVDDLHRLITYSSQQEKPFIFVGVELGAMIGRFYAQVYESEISDLVLIDPLVEDLFEQDQGVWVDLWFGHLLPYFQAHQLSAALGVTRLALLLKLMVPPLAMEGISEEVVKRQKHLLCNPRHLSSIVDEYHFINDSISQMQTLFMMKAFPANISTTVINGNFFDDQLPNKMNTAWAKSQQTLMSWLHPNNNHIIVNGADHHMIYRQPHTIIDPIIQLIKQRRNKQTSVHNR